MPRCCPHTRDVHEHYRDGSDCGLCRCRRYRRDRVGVRDVLWVALAFVAWLRSKEGR